MLAECHTRNTLDCDQSNYSSRIVFSHIPIECGHTGNSATAAFAATTAGPAGDAAPAAAAAALLLPPLPSVLLRLLVVLLYSQCND